MSFAILSAHIVCIETQTGRNDMTKDNQKKLIELVRDYGVFYSIFEEKLSADVAIGVSDESYKLYKETAERKIKEIQELIA